MKTNNKLYDIYFGNKIIGSVQLSIDIKLSKVAFYFNKRMYIPFTCDGNKLFVYDVMQFIDILKQRYILELESYGFINLKSLEELEKSIIKKEY